MTKIINHHPYPNSEIQWIDTDERNSVRNAPGCNGKLAAERQTRGHCPRTIGRRNGSTRHSCVKRIALQRECRGGKTSKTNKNQRRLVAKTAHQTIPFETHRAATGKPRRKERQMQHCPKTMKTVIELEDKPEHFLF